MNTMNTTQQLLNAYPFIECRGHTWGETRVISRCGDEEARILWMRPGQRTTIHAHQFRTEFQIPLAGVIATVGPGVEVLHLSGGHRAYLIRPRVLHGFCAPCDRPGMVLSLTYGRIENDRA